MFTFYMDIKCIFFLLVDYNAIDTYQVIQLKKKHHLKFYGHNK